MFYKFKLVLIGLLYFFGLELVVFRPNWLPLILFFLLAMALVEGKKIGKKWSFSILPVFFVLFSVALLSLVALVYEQQIFIILSTAMFYLLILGTYRLEAYEGDQTARGMLMAVTSTTIFFAFASTYGLYLNFLVPLYVLMLVNLGVTFFVSYQYFSIIKKEGRKVFLYSFILALIMAEIVWTINFWPFGYLTTGVVMLILYYVLWDLTQSYFLNLLSRKRVIANMVFFSALIVLVLLSAKWIPVI
jgi:hypothetical protein